MVRFWWMFIFFAKTTSGNDNALPDSEAGKESRFLPLFEGKRYDRPPLGPAGLPPLTQSPVAGERCSSRLESALDQMQRRKRNQPKNLESPLSRTLDLNGYSLRHQMRSAPIDMYVTRMRVRLPQNSNWVRVQKCYFDPRNVSLDTMLLFHDLTISGNVDLYDANELDRGVPPNRLRRNYVDRDPQFDSSYPPPDPGYNNQRGNGCNMILRLRKAGIGFHTRPLNQQPGKFNVKTDSEFVEPGFISVYAYGCERYINRNANWNKDNLPLRRRKRSDEFSFDPRMTPPYNEEHSNGRSADWDTVYEPPRGRLNYERSKLFRPGDDLDEVEDISREMEDIFTKGIRTLLTTYMKKELQPAIKDTLMRNMGYVISYG